MTTHYDQYLAPHLEMVRGIVRRHSYPASETADNFQSVVLVLLEHLEELGALAQGALGGAAQFDPRPWISTVTLHALSTLNRRRPPESGRGGGGGRSPRGGNERRVPPRPPRERQRRGSRTFRPLRPETGTRRAETQGAPRKGDRHARHVPGKLAHGAFASRFSPHEGGAAVDGDAAQGATSGFGLRLCAGAGCAVVACALGFGHGVAECGAAARRRVEFYRNRRGDGAECAFGAPVVEPRTRTARPSTRSPRRFSAEKFGRLSVFFHFCLGLGSFFPKVYHDLVVRRTEFVPAPFFFGAPPRRSFFGAAVVTDVFARRSRVYRDCSRNFRRENLAD